MIILLEKDFATGITEYDRYNSLRNMNDADILAEDKRKNPYSFGKAVSTAAMGTAVGATVGGGINLFRRGKSALGGAKVGAVLGGLGSTAYAMAKRSQGRNQVEEYNNRLDNAKRQAQRRERLDWYRNQANKNTNNEYTY